MEDFSYKRKSRSPSKSKSSSLSKSRSKSPLKSQSPIKEIKFDRLKNKNKPKLDPSSFQYKFNRKEGECRWPTVLTGGNVQDCRFDDFEVIEDYGNGIKVIVLPKGTLLYHKYSPGPTSTFKKDEPTHKRGGLFFNIRQDVQRMHFGTRQLIYKTPKDLNLVYVQNISSIFNYRVGEDFVKDIFKILKRKLEEQLNVSIDGYMGCNECEVYIINKETKKLKLEKEIMQDIRYI